MKSYTPFGAQTRSKQWSVFGGDPYPRYARTAYGSKVWCEGSNYTDWTASLGAIGVGYGMIDFPEDFTDTCLPLPTKLEEVVAEQMCTHVAPWADQCRFVKTGSEATAAAMLIARRATGRKKVVSIGYHGWHECHLPSENLVDVPMGSFRYFQEVDCSTAAVLLEPYRDEQPEEGYLEDIQAKCHEAGSLLIVDEMVTGFRWALGGATEREGLAPDLACFGKAMGNGYPIACVVGSEKLMREAHYVSSTFGGEVRSLEAARQTIDFYRKNEVCDRMWELGRSLQRLADGMVIGFPVHWRFNTFKTIAMVQHLAEKGHLCHTAGNNIMYAHTMQDVASLAEAIRSFEEGV